MSDVHHSQEKLIQLQEAMAEALSNENIEALEHLVTEREPYLVTVVDAVSNDRALRQWIHNYWERDQDILAQANRCLRVAQGRLSAYRMKRNASKSYMHDDRQPLEVGYSEPMHK